MLPLGRRRAGSLAPLTLLLGLVLLFASTASAAVIGIDFGTLNIKAALIKSGTTDVVLTKDSKRKEVAAVAFKPNRDEKNKIITEEGTFPERAYGGDALSLQGRLPGEVFPNLKLLLGLQPGEEGDQVAQVYKQRYPALQMESSAELGTTVFKSGAFAESVAPFTVEELVGMELANIRRNAELTSGIVDHAVITIPIFYTADEKRALIKAAAFAGLHVDALISDGMAVGLEYAKTRTFPDITNVTKGEKPEYHLVYDMGAGSATATLMRFQSRTVKDGSRRNKTVQEVAVMGAGWDRTLGGDALNTVIMEDFVEKLLSKPAVKSRGTTREEITSNGRLMGRFFKEAEKARHILSANTETSNSFEEILPDVDLRTKLTRAEFEKMTASFAERVGKPITDALAMAKLKAEDINSLIVHGGAMRTPFVQSQIEALVGGSKIRSSVNPDEAAVFGAAFKAATLSPAFQTKDIRDSDIAAYTTSFQYTDKGKERKQQLFTPSSPVGWGATTKQLSFKDKDDFSFSFVQSVGEVDRPIVTIKSENLTESVQELNTKFGCEKDDIVTKFGVRLTSQYGFPEVSGGTVSCEVDEKSGSVGDSVKGWLGFGKKKDQEPLGDEETDGPVEEVDASSSSSTSTKSAASSSSAAASSSKSPDPPKKRTETVQVRVSASSAGSEKSDMDFFERSSARLKAFDDSDRARYARDEAQNVLESYTYSVRDFLENSDYKNFGTKAVRDEISALLQSTREWMESADAGKATTETLKEKRLALKKLVEPIKTRKTEESKRPSLVKSLQKSLDDTQKLILKVQNEAEKASSSYSKALESMSSTTSSASASSSSDADELEEPESSSSTTVAPAAPTNAYANLNFDKVQETYDSISSWLVSTTAEQAKLKPHEEPVLLIRDLENKAKEMGNAMKDFSAAAKEARKPPKPAPKPKAKPTKKAAKSAAKEKATDVPVGEEEEVKIPKKGEEGYEEFIKGYEKYKEDQFRDINMDEILKMSKEGKGGEKTDDTVAHEEL